VKISEPLPPHTRG